MNDKNLHDKDGLKQVLYQSFKKEAANAPPSDMVQRVTLPQRPTTETSAGAQYLPDYWTEGASYQINNTHAEELRTATKELTSAYHQAMDYVTQTPDALQRFVFTNDEHIDEKIRLLVSQSWNDEKNKGYALDRYDLAYNGKEPPKLLERNFGFLGLVVASGQAQEEYIDWLGAQAGHEDAKSFGKMEDTVAKSFENLLKSHDIPKGSVISLVTPPEPWFERDPEVAQTTNLYAECIRKAGYEPQLHIADKVEHDTATGRINVHSDSGVTQLPDGWSYMPSHSYQYLMDVADKMAKDENALPSRDTKMLQPFWTYLAQHKAMLPVLHELFPDHPNLLETSMGEDGLQGQKRIVKRVLTSAGGGAVVLDETGTALDKRARGEWDTDNDPRSSITQAFASGAQNNLNEYAVLNVFTAHGDAIAVGAREARSQIVSDEEGTKTRYVPVILRNDDKLRQQDLPAPSSASIDRTPQRPKGFDKN